MSKFFSVAAIASVFLAMSAQRVYAQSDTLSLVDDQAVDAPLMPTSFMQYPEGSRRAGRMGSVYAVFTVDENGRIEAGSSRIISSSQADFRRTVRAWLESTTFRPPRSKGEPVRQRVCLPVHFLIANDARRLPKASVPKPDSTDYQNNERPLCERAAAISVVAERRPF
jgi:TonB family protein